MKRNVKCEKCMAILENVLQQKGGTFKYYCASCGYLTFKKADN